MPHQIAPVLLVVGAEDHTVPLGQYAKPEDVAALGDLIALLNGKVNVHLFREAIQRACRDRPASVLSPVGLQHLPEASRPENGSALLDAPRPGGYVVEGGHFLAEHAPLQESSAGTVIVEARRHLLDFGEMTPTESAELGSALHRLVPAIKAPG